MYLTLNEVSKAMLCALVAWIAWPEYSMRIAALGPAVWFLGQAIDEALSGNLWADGIWEYPALAIFSLLILWHLLSHAKDERRHEGSG